MSSREWNRPNNPFDQINKLGNGEFTETVLETKGF